eukprot:CAMPEP_0194036798 /NCGR_PEP_ID=MMETSP0009_2-20130614/9163_1 /TAXON_ID=210454 /ORGANISM="Grammatophora oceanica, Strain CCMP 410" /LENGTH=411 /DNA_ID=CAMNT_0038678707 /DNA_START=8 /DNA_END=1243 /DNA_ORIENTATION=+
MSNILSMLLMASAAGAFFTPLSHPRRSFELMAAPSGTRVLQAGAGIPIHDSGDLTNQWNPAVEGKLGGTGALEERLQKGLLYEYKDTDYLSPSPPESPPTTHTKSDVVEAQHWLEDLGVPQHFAKPSSPVTATILGRTRLISMDAPGDIQHVLLKLPDGMHYVEGQSLSVIPDGIDSKGKKHKPRLYSIASTRYGDVLDGNTVSLCVRRAEYTDPATGMVDPSKKGVCSNFLCDSSPGQKIQVAGPVGKTMLLPEDSSKDIIMVATGTGIAPFRAFLHRLFMEETVARHMFSGTAWLILGVPVSGGLLYPQEIGAMQKNAGPGQLEVDYAISREMTNAEGGKMYVQHVLQQNIEKLLDRLNNGAVIYFCGLKGMMPGILEALEDTCTKKGLDFSTKLKEWQANHQWHVEVY